MKPLKLPQYSFTVRESSSGKTIFDPVRMKYVALTPEEWVRQHFLNYMMEILGYPRGLIQVEASFRLNTLLRRADILVSDRSGSPALIVECKAADVKITQAVFDQIINYNFSYSVDYLIVTNGIKHYAARVDKSSRSFSLMDHIPSFEEINSH